MKNEFIARFLELHVGSNDKLYINITWSWATDSMLALQIEHARL